MKVSKEIKQKEKQLKMDKINGEQLKVDSIEKEKYEEAEQYEWNEEGIRGLDY